MSLASVLVASAAQKPMMLHAMPGAPSVASFRVEVSQNGFNGQSDLVVRVQPGQEVEITFTYGDAALNDPEQRHQIQIDGYDVDVSLDLEHQEATVKFPADKVGSFAIHCHVKCRGHRMLQDGLLVVGTVPAPGAAGAQPPAATALTITSAAASSNGTATDLSAALTDASGQPMSGAPITFYLEQAFLGANGRQEIGSVQTDASGVGTIQYQPHADGDLTAVARFDGIGNYSASEAKSILHVEGSLPAYIPTGRSTLDIPGWGPWWIFMLVGAVWLTYSFVYLQVYRIRQNR